MFNPLHKHVLIRGTVEIPFTEVEQGKKLLTGLVDAIGMTPVTEPQCVYIHDLGNEGLTGSINLAESHIAFHVWDRTGLLMMDVYSCKDFDHNTVIEQVEKFFGKFAKYEMLILNRENFHDSEIISKDTRIFGIVG